MKKILLLSVICLCSCTIFNSEKTIKENDKLSLSLQVGALDKALAIATENVKKHPESVSAKFALADIYYQQAKYDLQYITLSSISVNEETDPADFINLKLKLVKNSLKRNQYNDALSNYEAIINNRQLTQQQRGKLMEYAGVAFCKLKQFDKCLDLLSGAMKVMPGDTSVIDNISIANYMKNSQHGRSDITSLYRGYHDSGSGAMFANLILALIKENKVGQAFKLLNQHYSSSDSMKIIEELRVISNENNA